MSYSFFLTHMLALTLCTRLMDPYLSSHSVHPALMWLWYPACFAVATMAATAFFLLFERHFIPRPSLAALPLSPPTQKTRDSILNPGFRGTEIGY